MKKFIKSWATRILFTAMSTTLVGVTASASTSSVWEDSVRSASTLADHAKTHINGSKDCKGLNKLLELGASASGGSPSDTLGELRSELLELDLLAATVKFASNQSNDASAREASQEAYERITGMKLDVSQTLIAKVKFCGNGVEKGPQH